MNRWLFACILAVSVVAAADSFSSSLIAEKTTIFQDEAAAVTVSITNHQNFSDLFTFSLVEFDWFLDTAEDIRELPGGASKDYTLIITPKAGLSPGTRAVRIKVRSTNTDEFDTHPVVVTVQSVNGSGRQYVPSIFLSAQTPNQIDPAEPFTIGVYLRNRNARSYEAVDVKIVSDLFTKEYATALGGIGVEGEKTNQITLAIDPYSAPGSHPLTITLSVEGQVVNEYKTNLVIASRSNLATVSSETSSWFKKTTIYTVTNNGNIVDTEIVLHKASLLSRLFTSSSSEYSVQKDAEGKNLALPITLQPGQTGEITLVENYRLLAILVLLVILSVVSYFLFRSPVVLRKEAVIIGGKEGVSEMKIRVFIKNRGSKTLTGIHIIDRVTSMADVVKETSLGTLQPSKVVTKKGHGTLVRWDIDQLEAFEERIITYRVKTQLKLIGDVYLPAAKAKFDASGKERTSYSNEVNIPREH